MFKKKNEMTCAQAQSLIDDYVGGLLDEESENLFNHHVYGCEACMEELKVNYSILTALKQLDAGEELSENFEGEVTGKVTAYVEKKRLHRILIRVAFGSLFVICVIFGMFLASVSSVYNDVTYSKNPEDTTVNFVYDGVPDYMDPVDKAISKYNSSAVNYIHSLKNSE